MTLLSFVSCQLTSHKCEELFACTVQTSRRYVLCMYQRVPAWYQQVMRWELDMCRKRTPWQHTSGTDKMLQKCGPEWEWKQLWVYLIQLSTNYFDNVSAYPTCLSWLVFSDLSTQHGFSRSIWTWQGTCRNQVLHTINDNRWTMDVRWGGVEGYGMKWWNDGVLGLFCAQCLG